MIPVAKFRRKTGNTAFGNTAIAIPIRHTSETALFKADPPLYELNGACNRDKTRPYGNGAQRDSNSALPPLEHDRAPEVTTRPNLNYFE